MKEIEIPFGAKDSELKGWEYTIPEGMEAEIKDGKIVVREKESEDERIRKELMDIIEKSYIYGGFTLNSKKDLDRYLAWLEKQKESTWTEEDESFRKHILPRILNPTSWTLEQVEADRGLLKEFVERQKNKWVEKQKEPENVSATTMAPSCWEVEQKEQKPEERFEEAREKYQVEWSEEDDQLIGFIFDLLNDLVWQKDWAMSKEECLERLKSLRPWKLSENEERLINTSISFLKDFADKGYENAVECIDWLKSKLNGNSGK